MDLFEDQDEKEIFNDGDDMEISNDHIETNENDGEEEEKKTVKPKRVVRHPRAKLNAELLRGPKGLGNLEKSFERVQFKGKGYEEHDLNVLLKTYEYWCHRLFPKFPFKDCVDKIEKLGSKGPIQTYLKKVRSGLEDNHNETPNVLPDFQSDEDEPGPSNVTQSSNQPPIVDIPIQLTEEQMETIRRNREKAEKLRQERLRKIQEKAAFNLPEKHLLSEASKMSESNKESITEEVQPNFVPNEDTPQEKSYNADDTRKNHFESQSSQGANNCEFEKIDSDSDSEFNCWKKQSKKIFDEEEEIVPRFEMVEEENKVTDSNLTDNCNEIVEEMDVD